jgi:hypothetical protein
MLRWIWNHFIENKAAAWQAGCAIALVVITFLLYRVSDSTNETTKATQRAVVGFSGISGGVTMTSADFKVKTAQEVLLNWTNSGSTRAANAITNGSGDVWPTALPQGYNFPDLPTSHRQPITLGPRESSGVRALIPIEDFRTTREGKSHLFAWGWIVYDDVFSGSPTHLTEFCVEMIQITIPFGKEITDPNAPLVWNVERCAEHNCYDQECSDYSARVKDARGK